MIPLQPLAPETEEKAAQSQGLAHYMRPGLLQLSALPPLALYVHIPWCLKKCPYCDFNSHEQRSADLPVQQYLDALQADLEAALPMVWGRPVHSIFIGGGTPSLFPPEAIDAMLAAIRARLPLLAGCEISLEANPGTFEKDRFKAFRTAGINRLSVGVQSFDDRFLKSLGRVHDGHQAMLAMQEAAATFDTFNLDLMYALPGQSLQDLQHDIDLAMSLKPSHLSIYQLTVETNTVFAKHPPALPDDDLVAEMMDLITATTVRNGMRRYEVSAYSQPGKLCLHNLNYWQFGDYLGIGAGAHSKLSFAHRIVRQVRFRDPARYILQALKGQAVTIDEEVKREDMPLEFALNALRLVDGFPLSLFTERTGLPLTVLREKLEKAQQLRLLELSLSHAAPTDHGMDFLNDLQTIFLPSV